MSEDLQTFPDSIIYHGLEDCLSFRAIKTECQNWCKQNNIPFCGIDFQSRLYDILERDFQK